MTNHSKKSTKKFEKKHLKDVLERRKAFAKVKQRHQMKEKRKARRANQDREDEPQPEAQASGQAAPKKNLQDVTMDEFFQGGFEIADGLEEAKSDTAKRKRDGNESDQDSAVSWEENPVADDSESEPEKAQQADNHKADLEALATQDPDFYNYLKENDAELLDFSVDADGINEFLSSDEEEQASNTSKKVKMTMIKKWRKLLDEKKSLRSTREVVLAFRAAAHSDDEVDKTFKYELDSADVYHELLLLALKHIPAVLEHHLPVKETASGKVRVPTDSKKYRSLMPILNSHAISLLHLLSNLSDAATLKVTISSLAPLLPYLLSFKKVLRNLLKSVVEIWSDDSSEPATRVSAFLLMRRLAVIGDPSIKEAVLKAAYQGLVKGSRSTSVHNLAGINLMKNSAVELWGFDTSLGYTTGFTYIRQLAIHLRTSMVQPTKDSYKKVYNWQYVHSLDFWSRVLSVHCSPDAIPTLKKPADSALYPLIYPLVQVTLGALRLIPTAAYFPLRFQLVRSLLRISRSTDTYIPLMPVLLEVLQSAELRHAPKASTLKPLDFESSIRAPKSYLRTRVYQDGVGEQVVELVAEFFGVWCKSVAYPELSIPPVVLLKRWLKEVRGSRGPKTLGGNKNQKLNSAVATLVQKIEANAAFVEQKRDKVEFSVSNKQEVERFLKDMEWEDMPIGAYVASLRKLSEEKKKVLEQGRRERDERRADRKRETDMQDDDTGEEASEMELDEGGDSD